MDLEVKVFKNALKPIGGGRTTISICYFLELFAVFERENWTN